MDFQKLYKKTSTGKTQHWQIIVENDSYYTLSGQVGGKTYKRDSVLATPKNIGKSNETTAEEQAIIEAKARFDKKIKEGYKENIEEIDDFTFVKPMLAKNFEDYKHQIDYPVVVQVKYNGTRCISTKDGMFTRKGEKYFSVPHIWEEIKLLFESYPDLILDGELGNYDMRENLNRVSKLVSVNRKQKDITKDLLDESRKHVKYYLYDGYGTKSPISCKSSDFLSRYEKVKSLLNENDFIKFTENKIANSEKDVYRFLNEFIKDKEEGAIVRVINSPYENKRSKYLLKLKKFFDDEFEVLDIQEGKGNWSGKAKRIVCKLHKPTNDGRETFDSNIKGTEKELKEIFENKEDYIGKMATIKYQNISEYGVPQLPYLIAWRDYE